jgi:3-hydroxyacyl-[acyl-carrier-protein] dehydratase
VSVTATAGTSTWTTLDRLVSVEPGRSAVALRNVTNTLAIFDTHFPRFPVLPGVLILGSLGELAAVLLREQTGRRWRLAAAEQIKYRHFVQPGDQVELTVAVIDLSDDDAVLKGDARVAGRVVTQARRLHMVPIDR